VRVEEGERESSVVRGEGVVCSGAVLTFYRGQGSTGEAVAGC
jgi:hypothetical protein